MPELYERDRTTRKVYYIEANLAKKAFNLHDIPTNTELPFDGYTKDCDTIPVKIWDKGTILTPRMVEKIKEKGIEEVFVKEEDIEEVKEIVQENIEQNKEAEEKLKKANEEKAFIDGIKNYFCIDKRIIKLASEINFSIYLLTKSGTEKIYDAEDKNNDIMFEKNNIASAGMRGDLCIAEQDMENYNNLILRLSKIPNADIGLVQKAVVRENIRMLCRKLYESKGGFNQFRALQNLINPLINLLSSNKFSDMAFLGHRFRHLDIHVYNTAVLCGILGKNILEKSLLFDVVFGALCHDIGKTEISHSILIRCGSKISDTEYGILRNHAERSSDIIKKFFGQGILNMVRKHHLRPDGRGYPDPFKEKLLSMPEKILSLANSFENLITPNGFVLKVALKPHEALAKLQKEILEKKIDGMKNLYITLVESLK